MLRSTALFLMTLLPLPAAAQCVGEGFLDMLPLTDRAELMTLASEMPYGEGLYWRATKGDVELTILGTMHLPDPRHAQIVRMVSAQLNVSDILLVEATLQDQSDMQVFMSRNPDLLSITSGPTLPELLDADTWATIQEATAARGIPSFMAAKMQPWFLAMTLSLPPCAMASMVAGEAGLDAQLMGQAAANDVPVAPLEPWEDMLDLMSSGTFDEQVETLELALMPPDLQDAMVTELTNLYFEGNTAATWHMSRYAVQFMPNITLEDFDAAMAEMEDALLWTRNRAWIPVIEDVAQTHDDIFIAFGAAHLMGEDGVLTLLTQNGWTVEPR